MEECHCPITVWEGKIFWSRLYPKSKKVLNTLSHFALKTRYIVFQHRLLFNLVRDLFKWIELLGRSVIARLQSKREKIFDLGCIQKKHSILCQISRSKTRYIVFQHKLLFNLVKDLFEWIEALGRSVTVRVQSERDWVFVLGCIWKKITRYVVKFLAQKLAIVFQHKLLFNIVKDIFNWIEDLERSVTVQVHSERVRFSVLGCVWKMYSMRCQISRSKTRYSVST